MSRIIVRSETFQTTLVLQRDPFRGLYSLPRNDDAPLCIHSRDPLFRIPSILLVLVNRLIN